jgi:hypothetical protein
MHATLRRMGTKEEVGTVELKEGRAVVRASLEVASGLTVYFASAHTWHGRDERGAPITRAIEPGTEEHFALRLEGLPALGLFADDVKP